MASLAYFDALRWRYQSRWSSFRSVWREALSLVDAHYAVEQVDGRGVGVVADHELDRFVLAPVCFCKGIMNRVRDDMMCFLHWKLKGRSLLLGMLKELKSPDVAQHPKYLRISVVEAHCGL